MLITSGNHRMNLSTLSLTLNLGFSLSELGFECSKTEAVLMYYRK